MSSDAPTDGAPPNASTAEDDAAAKRALLEKIKDAANGPEHARRRIEALDKMVHNLKSRRKTAGEQMEADTKELFWLDKEVEKINKIYKPLCKRLEERIQTRDQLKQTIETTSQTFQNLIKLTSATQKTGSIKNRRHQRKSASQNLRTARGYSTTPESTPYQSGGSGRRASSSRKK